MASAVTPVPIMEAVSQPDGMVRTGLSGSEARRRRAESGTNTLPDTSPSTWRMVLEKFWAPVPWMLEAAVILQCVLGRFVEAGIIAGLLVFNAVLGVLQESRAQATLAALKSRLAMNASVLRDGTWSIVPAADLVKGDVVKLSLGGVVAADMRIVSGNALLDHSMLTGESVPIEATSGTQTFAGALVRRGEALALVTAIGANTRFGQTAELVRTAHVASSQQKAVLLVVRNLAAFSVTVIAFLVCYALYLRMPLADIVPLILTAVLASIPVALPATFTLSAALGARALAAQGVLSTRLSAVDEVGTMDVLCADKTGTLTCNALSVSTVAPMHGFDISHVLTLAALASAEGNQDPVDQAIRDAASRIAHTTAAGVLKLAALKPFDPSTKTSEATVTDPSGKIQRIVKGASAVVVSLSQASPTAQARAAELEGQGLRVLAVAAGATDALQLVGLVALSDPPRADSAALIKELHGLGVRVVMVTGDAPATAAIVAQAIGLTGPTCPAGYVPDQVEPQAFAVFAGVLPEDKYKLVKAFQQTGHTVGMCGDGANDAPALRQAQIGIAVSTATDVAKSAAGMVLTEAGLGGIVMAVKEGRLTFQRILTYTLNSVLKKIATAFLLVIGLLITGHAILTPLLMVILMIAGDFLAMSLTTDRVEPSPLPNAWRISNLTVVGVFIGLALVTFCSGVLAIGKFAMGLNIDALRTLTFVVLVFGGQATLYAIRHRRRMWGTRPSVWMVASSVADVLIAAGLAMGGIAMAALPPELIGGLLAATVVFAFALAAAKIPVFAHLKIS
ncbi:HAD-IC family P-type ATPase [Paraburkholderia humisilvae]|uniref:Calcium-transporting ATPase 1 n=1 Tax=Paraburkholderia humisilvae TaxID=627669 RepID=A0A6J5F690_9BURK|nr:HAD-IC family P-type ATPase [Paraburkholderia humisilvae]CAB3774044.1 Calcium-transporting ATPase 1 [Paraburkholderia humisilvae]